MKILVIAGYAESLIKFRGHLLDALVRQGNEVTACAPGHDASIVEQLSKRGVAFQSIPLQRTGMNPFQDIYTLFCLYFLILKAHPDIVFAYTIKPVIYGSLAARLAGVKNCYAMITGLGSSFQETSTSKKFLNFLVCHLYRFSLKKNKAVFFQNLDDRDLFLRLDLIGKITKTVLVDGSGVDLNYYSFAPVVKGQCVFLLIARIIREKGIEQYVEAARQLKVQHNDVRFLLVGWFDTNPSAIGKETVMDWQKQGIIEYLGAVDDVRPLIASASVYVLPTYYGEGTPRTILEAMSMGRPVITTDAPGCRETVCLSGSSSELGLEERTEKLKVGRNGILVPVKDVRALADAMEFFIKDPDQIRLMGQESRAYAEERYDVHKVTALMIREMGLD